MTYQETLAYLRERCHGGAPAGLARMQMMARLLGQPQEQVPMIHLAGTNGKGSTTAMMAAVLRESGQRVAVYTSPHLLSYTERITLDGVSITEADFAQIMGMLQQEIVPQLLAAGLAHPSEFELLTMTAFVYFARQRADLALIEVGLGGRLDSTNIVQPILTVITPISLDHCQILGDTIAAIAAEKAGIIKPGVPVVAAIQRQEALAVIAERAKMQASPLYKADDGGLIRLSHDLTGQVFSLRTPTHSYARLAIKLLGHYQLINATTAVYGLEVLAQRGYWSWSEAVLMGGLAQARWPGRMEYLPREDGRGILLDGAHNADGIAALAEALQEDFAGRPLTLLLGILDDKEQEKMMRTLLPLADRVLITRPAETRAENWSHLAVLAQAICPTVPVQLFDHLAQALACAVEELPAGGLLCVTGSLYLLGGCREFLRREKLL